MAIKIKIPRGKRGSLSLSDPIVRGALAIFLILATITAGVFAHFYVKYQKLIDARMAGPVFNNASKIYARPRVLHTGQKITRDEIVGELRRAGYTEGDEGGDAKLGAYKLVNRGVEIRPGPESYHSSEGALVRVEGGTIQKITSLAGNDSLGAYELEPLLLTGIFDSEQRSKRRLVNYNDIPENLVNAVLAIEDRRFFQHSGVNYLRFLQAAWIDLKRGRHAQGGSTLTMQISRGFFLTPDKTIKRKLAEMMIAVEMEQRFSKKQIFEFYANQVYMGQRGSFTINGMGEAAQAYFGKDLKDLTLPECALLAGIIQRPNYLSPYKNAERALSRRNTVLESMVDTGAVTRDQAENAKATKLALTAPSVDASDAPYLVDMVKDMLLSRYSEEQLNEDGLRIYSGIDPELQAAASKAIETGMKLVDEQVIRQRTRKVKTGKGKSAKTETVVREGPMPQAALIAIDPETGEVLALIGGRNYGFSQLNHAIAKRPTGSIFKPFVYAAAMNNAVTGDQPVVTPATLIEDAPTTFAYEDKVYEPRNFGEEYFGQVTARYALAHSLNNATVKLAEEVGYGKVVSLAREAGISGVRATPAMALGSYDATAMEMAGAYTAFANGGMKSAPILVKSIRDASGDIVEDFKVERKRVLDPRVAYVITNMMEAVINNGTAAGVRARGFTAPAAGKTGTSHDAWFAGYTSNLLCIVWVGNDDYTDLKLEGAKTAAPIWAEFMKLAQKLPAYKDVQPFKAPDGVVVLQLDKVTNRIATPACPETYTSAFIAGTEPTETCEQAAGEQRSFFQKLLGIGPKPSGTPPVSNPSQAPQPGTPGQAQSANQPGEPPKKKSFFGKIFGSFKDEKDKDKNPGKAPPVPNQPPPR